MKIEKVVFRTISAPTGEEIADFIAKHKLEEATLESFEVSIVQPTQMQYLTPSRWHELTFSRPV